ncbi:MAG: serine/threonine protein phosphatase [Ruminococcus sp.]|nr:serine/threonine protein phosphatase [Ruminococcus sp.]MBR6670454.1 serine/threonine protein phosphatase [Ruminococcus sp.]
MKLFKNKKDKQSSLVSPEIHTAFRDEKELFPLPECTHKYEYELYERLRSAVPIVDAALMKIVRLTGGYRVICSDDNLQSVLDYFLDNVPVGIAGKSVYSFTDCYLDNLLTYGSAVGELIIDENSNEISGLYIGRTDNLEIVRGKTPVDRCYRLKCGDSYKSIKRPDRILFTSLGTSEGKGKSLLYGLPALSGILLRIYQCIGQNFDRAGNIRYAVTYKPPSDSGERSFAKERAIQIAKEWSDGMTSAKYGQVKDFIAVGDVDIKVIGAENQLYNTEIPVRQLLEQIIAKLSIPPFLLGLNWSSTERMSAQQADILTSELEYYRRLMTPVICSVGNAYLRSVGSMATCSVEWSIINLQDEKELAEARLKNAQASEIEHRLANNI